LIDDPNSAEFERISKKYKAAVAKSKPLLEETYNDRNPNRFSESRKQPSLRDEGNDIYRVGRTSKEDRRKLRPLPRSANTSGLTAGHGVIVRLDCTRNLRLLTHEFVHVAQYERLGREGFLQQYIQQIAAHGYPDAPFEQEVEAKSRSNA
jgi:hypothetical protein